MSICLNCCKSALSNQNINFNVKWMFKGSGVRARYGKPLLSIKRTDLQGRCNRHNSRSSTCVSSLPSRGATLTPFCESFSLNSILLTPGFTQHQSSLIAHINCASASAPKCTLRACCKTWHLLTEPNPFSFLALCDVSALPSSRYREPLL